MTKGPTKAQLALAEAREWIEASKVEVGEREAALDQARSQLEMHETIYAILEKTFTRQPTKAAATKKASKKSSKSVGKSARVQGLSEAVRGSLQRRVPTGATDDDEATQQACVFKNGDYNCGLGVDSPVHCPDGGYAGYHPFVSPSPARNADERSSSGKFTPSSLPASSEVETESVSSATGG